MVSVPTPPAPPPHAGQLGQATEAASQSGYGIPPWQGAPAEETSGSSTKPTAVDCHAETGAEREPKITELRADRAKILCYHGHTFKSDRPLDDCLIQPFREIAEHILRAKQPATRLDLGRIQQARQEISRVFRDTPQFHCHTLGSLLGCELVIKLETANPIGCFKGRGTDVMLSRLARNPGTKSAVCASAGNLGQALAYSGRSRGIDVTVVAGSSANAAKIERIRQLGAAVELVEGDIESARERAREIAHNRDAFLVEDSENLDTCEGAGTIGLELLDGFDRIDTIMIALGGGALATGMGHVFKALSPATEVVCVQPRGAPAMAMSWRARSIVTTDSTDTIADGVAGRFPIPAVLADLLAVADHVPLVEEESIIAGMRMLYQYAALVVEPSAALGVAAILEDPSRYRNKRVVVVICGSNVISEEHTAWMQGGIPQCTPSFPQGRHVGDAGTKDGDQKGGQNECLSSSREGLVPEW